MALEGRTPTTGRPLGPGGKGLLGSDLLLKYALSRYAPKLRATTSRTLRLRSIVVCDGEGSEGSVRGSEEVEGESKLQKKCDVPRFSQIFHQGQKLMQCNGWPAALSHPHNSANPGGLIQFKMHQRRGVPGAHANCQNATKLGAVVGRANRTELKVRCFREATSSAYVVKTGAFEQAPSCRGSAFLKPLLHTCLLPRFLGLFPVLNVADRWKIGVSARDYDGRRSAWWSPSE